MVGLLRQYLAHFYNSLWLDCYVNIWHTSRILFDCIVTLVNVWTCPLVACRNDVGYWSNEVFKCYCGSFFFFFLYFGHFLISFWLNCYFSIFPHFKIIFGWIVMLVSRARLEFSLIGLLRYYLAHFWNSIWLDCYVTIFRTFRILFNWIVTSASRALFELSLIGLIR